MKDQITRKELLMVDGISISDIKQKMALIEINRIVEFSKESSELETLEAFLKIEEILDELKKSPKNF